MEQREGRGDVGLNDRIFLIPGSVGCQHITEVRLRFVALERIDTLATRLEADGIDVVNAVCGTSRPKEIFHLSPYVLIQGRDSYVGGAGSKEAVSRIGLHRVRDDGQRPV